MHFKCASCTCSLCPIMVSNAIYSCRPDGKSIQINLCIIKTSSDQYQYSVVPVLQAVKEKEKGEEEGKFINNNYP